MTALRDGVATELTRLVRRWHLLPLDQAVAFSPALRALIERYAALVHPDVAVPDLGPAVVADQMTVVTYDALLAGVLTAGVAEAVLVRLRHTLAGG